MRDVAVIDLFCGIGGLSHGFVKEHFNVVAGIDIDSSCQFSFEKNNHSKFISKSITEVTGEEINHLFGQKAQVKILVGCAPCQPFSSYTFKNKEKSDNNKWRLLYEFSRLVRESKPHVISMENVSQLLNFKKAPVFEDFIHELESLGYYVHYEVVNCPDYGIPQNRKRLVLLASQLGKINLIPKTHENNYQTVKDAIGFLPKINDGEINKEDPLHTARKLSELNKKRIKNTPYGGSWKHWPEEIKLKCHKKASGKSYPSVYGRMIWEKPSPTITTHCTGYGNGRFGHPEQDRAISLREAALLQTFPMDYEFFDKNKNNSFSSTIISRQLGNAVPVKLGEVIAKSIKKHLLMYLK